ncbi:MAG TPA: hypothetical protein VE869_09515, partial [Gemmatimonas sp.]|nr:hypothetical protein [Gemmatimonas sp.]
DKAVFDAGASYVDRDLENRIARVAFGDTTVRRHTLKDDVQLRRAVDLLRKSNTQQEVFAAAGSHTASRPAPARRND